MTGGSTRYVHVCVSLYMVCIWLSHVLLPVLCASLCVLAFTVLVRFKLVQSENMFPK